jgi:hypothetical protein
LQPLVLGTQAAQLVFEGRQVAFAGEGLAALGIEVFLPLAEQAFGDAEVGSGLGEAASLLGDKLDGLDLELAGERASGFAHCQTSSRRVYTLF